MTDEAPYNFNENLIQGCVFSEYSRMGPESLFAYPIPNDSGSDIKGLESHYHTFSSTNYMQVSVKSISLLMTDYSFEKDAGDKLSSVHIFGVLPYPEAVSDRLLRPPWAGGASAFPAMFALPVFAAAAIRASH